MRASALAASAALLLPAALGMGCSERTETAETRGEFCYAREPYQESITILRCETGPPVLLADSRECDDRTAWIRCYHDANSEEVKCDYQRYSTTEDGTQCRTCSSDPTLDEARRVCAEWESHGASEATADCLGCDDSADHSPPSDPEAQVAPGPDSDTTRALPGPNREEGR